MEQRRLFTPRYRAILTNLYKQLHVNILMLIILHSTSDVMPI